VRVDATDEGTNFTLELATLASAGAGGRWTPLSVIVLTLPRGRGALGCAEWTPVLPIGLPIGLRAGIPCATIVIPGLVFSFFVTCGAVVVDAGMGSAEDIDGRMLFRLGRRGAGGALLHLAVGVAGTCTLLFFGRRNWRIGACGAAMVDFV
jgi:hypothetical protein